MDECWTCHAWSRGCTLAQCQTKAPLLCIHRKWLWPDLWNLSMMGPRFNILYRPRQMSLLKQLYCRLFWMDLGRLQLAYKSPLNSQLLPCCTKNHQSSSLAISSPQWLVLRVFLTWLWGWETHPSKCIRPLFYLFGRGLALGVILGSTHRQFDFFLFQLRQLLLSLPHHFIFCFCHPGQALHPLGCPTSNRGPRHQRWCQGPYKRVYASCPFDFWSKVI